MNAVAPTWGAARRAAGVLAIVLVASALTVLLESYVRFAGFVFKAGEPNHQPGEPGAARPLREIPVGRVLSPAENVRMGVNSRTGCGHHIPKACRGLGYNAEKYVRLSA